MARSDNNQHPSSNEDLPDEMQPPANPDGVPVEPPHTRTTRLRRLAPAPPRPIAPAPANIGVKRSAVPNHAAARRATGGPSDILVDRGAAGPSHSNTYRDLPVPRAPRRPSLIPWEPAWPEIVEYYLHHEPDFTGLGLYHTTRRYPAEYARLALQSPEVLTGHILLAESARAENRPPEHKLLWLKGETLRLTNQMLQNPDVALNSATLTAVVSLAVHNMIFEDGSVVATHLRGVKRIVEMRGGLEALSDVVRIREILLYFDSFHAYLTGSERYFDHDPTDAYFSFNAAHPLRLAGQPLYSNVPSYRMRNHLLVSFASPLQRCIFCFREMLYIAQNLQSMHGLDHTIVGNARSTAKELESSLLLTITQMRHNRLPLSVFSKEDCDFHSILCECALRCTLVLVCRFLEVIHQAFPFRVPESGEEGLASSYREYNVLLLFRLDLDTMLARCPEIALWAIATGAMFADDENVRKMAIQQIIPLSYMLRIMSWENVLSKLTPVFFCPYIQEHAGQKLWGDVQRELFRETYDAELTSSQIDGVKRRLPHR